MRRFVGWSAIAFLVYIAVMYAYLFYMNDTGIPSRLKGTSADPSTFMTPREVMLSEEFSKIKNLIFFISIPYEWFMMIVILCFGFSRKFSVWAAAVSSKSFVQAAIYAFWLSLFTFILSLPLDWIGYEISKSYHITTQSFQGWMKDNVINFWVSYGLMVIIVYVLYRLIRKFEKRWWLYAWLLSVPFTIFLTFIQPVVIDPLYNDFSPLKNKELEEKILMLADEAEIPAEHVYEVNMSEKTNALNAYVTGIGENSRIVLWDTTLNKLKEEEILFIMAHEMGHYVMKHIYIGVGGYLLLSFIGLYMTSRLLNRILVKRHKLFQIKHIGDLSSLPLILLILSVLSFTASPFTNAVSRFQEHKADEYAIEMTNEKEAAVSSFQQLTKAGLSQVNPPFFVKIFRYGHPTILERIAFIEQYHE
jgi:Zn-dependent protease with chaperone function